MKGRNSKEKIRSWEKKKNEALGEIWVCCKFSISSLVCTHYYFYQQPFKNEINRLDKIIKGLLYYFSYCKWIQNSSS